jgi:hypothetical protein
VSFGWQATDCDPIDWTTGSQNVAADWTAGSRNVAADVSAEAP